MRNRPRIIPACRAFSLPELMVAMTVFMLVTGGVFLTQIMGMKMYNITASKLSANDECRKGVSKMSYEIRSAKAILTGTGTAASFAQVTNGVPQQGNSIMIYSFTNGATPWVRYYLDAQAQQLKRVTDTTTNNPTVVADFVTNTIPFYEENYSGAVLTQYQNNRTVHLQLQFFQIQYPVIRVGPGCLYDYYQINTRITRRALF